jgi:uncharacterized membrane protein
MASLASAFRRPGPQLLTAIFAGSGILHFLRPGPFESIVPPALPRKRELVYLSGAAELICAAGLARRARWAGPATAAVRAAVWPANISMAVESTRGRQSVLRQVVAWGRIPLQIPLIAGAWRAGDR